MTDPTSLTAERRTEIQVDVLSWTERISAGSGAGSAEAWHGLARHLSGHVLELLLGWPVTVDAERRTEMRAKVLARMAELEFAYASIARPGGRGLDAAGVCRDLHNIFADIRELLGE